MDLSYIVGSNTAKIGEVNATLGKGEVAYVTGDVSKLIGKTAYVVTDKDAYAGLEITLDNGVTWHSLIAARDEVLRDEFTGANNDPIPTKWLATRHKLFNPTYTYAKINENKLRIGVMSTSGYSQSAVTSKDSFTLGTEKVIELTIDETQFPVGVENYDMIVGLVSVLPVEGGGGPATLVGSNIFQIINGNVIRNATTYAIPDANNAQIYRIVISSTSVKVYRGATLIIDQADTLASANYHMFIQTSAATSASSKVADVDNIIIWSRDATAKTKANKLWVKTLADVVPDKLRLVIQNDFVSDCKVKAALYGQA